MALKNQNFLVLWLISTQTIQLKQNLAFFHGAYSNLTLFFIGRKILKYFNDFYNCHFSISLQSEHNQVKRNKITWDMCKFDSVFPVIVKGNWTLSTEKITVLS